MFNIKPRTPDLEDDVHVWVLDRSASSGIVRSNNWYLLSHEEQLRATRFKLGWKREQFIGTRSALRCLLASYFNTLPEAIQFEYSQGGKPTLGGALRGQAHFSVSHSCNRSLIALAADREIGVDLERLRDKEIHSLAARVLSAKEYAQLASGRVADRAQRFFAAWCEREAYLKATGVGLAGGLVLARSLFAQIGLVDAQPAKPRCLGKWRFYHLPVFPGYASAVCVAGETTTVRVIELSNHGRRTVIPANEAGKVSHNPGRDSTDGSRQAPPSLPEKIGNSLRREPFRLDGPLTKG